MIDYQLYCQIKDRHDKDGLTITQIARELHLSPRTVGRWLAEDRFRQRLTPPRPSKLDTVKPQVAGVSDEKPGLEHARDVIGHLGVTCISASS